MIGWIGSILLAFCAAPQALKAYVDGEAKGLSLITLIMWTTGEVCTLIALLYESQLKYYLIFNYGCNILLLSGIWKYKLFPRNEDFNL